MVAEFFIRSCTAGTRSQCLAGRQRKLRGGAERPDTPGSIERRRCMRLVVGDIKAVFCASISNPVVNIVATLADIDPALAASK
jgi:hypothetical protein